MSVFTELDEHEIGVFLSDFSLGNLEAFQGITNGIENTNYLLGVNQKKYVLTLFEHFDTDQAAPYLELLDYLATQGVPCPKAFTDTRGNSLNILKRRPAALFGFVPGDHPDKANSQQLSELGKHLAHLHLTTQDYSSMGFNNSAHDDVIQGARSQFPGTKEQWGLFEQAYDIAYQAQRDSLPQSIIHGDLFRDNALFRDDQLSAFLDFYSASRDAMLLDVAVCASDWCRTPEHRLDIPALELLKDAYQQQRKWTQEEHSTWPNLLVFAALRYWCSRLMDRQQSFIVGQAPDPYEYEALLRDLIEHHI